MWNLFTSSFKQEFQFKTWRLLWNSIIHDIAVISSYTCFNSTGMFSIWLDLSVFNVIILTFSANRWFCCIYHKCFDYYFLPTDGSVASHTKASIILYHLISVMCSRCNDIRRSWQMKVTNFRYTVSIICMQLLHAIGKTIEWKYSVNALMLILSSLQSET